VIDPRMTKAASKSFLRRVVGEGELAKGMSPHPTDLDTLPNPLSEGPFRPRVSGMSQPRRPSSKFYPSHLGRQKGTVPTNPFSGNRMKWSGTKTASAGKKLFRPEALRAVKGQRFVGALLMGSAIKSEARNPNTKEEFERIKGIAEQKGVPVVRKMDKKRLTALLVPEALAQLVREHGDQWVDEGDKLCAEHIGPAFFHGLETEKPFIYMPEVSPFGSSPAVLAHELGHATGSKFLQESKVLRGTSAVLGALGPSLALSSAYLDDLPVEKKLRLISVGLGMAAASAAPTLAEEARATGRALRAGYRRGNALSYAKVLAPAYSTYLIPPAIAAGGAVLSEKARKMLLREMNK
jgi:hypothetical protein